MRAGGVVEYMSESWHRLCNHTEGQGGLLVYWNTGLVKVVDNAVIL